MPTVYFLLFISRHDLYYKLGLNYLQNRQGLGELCFPALGQFELFHNAALVWEPGLFPGNKYQVTKSVARTMCDPKHL